MNKEKLKEWFIDTSVRAVKTIAEAILGFIGASVYMGEVNWGLALSASVLAGISCFLINLEKLDLKRRPGGDANADVEKE